MLLSSLSDFALFDLQRKRMVVPAALKVVRLKPSRKVSLQGCFLLRKENKG